ncbi:hypothetical protein B0H19DRAFT_1265543 [Mycena capillaripes]|nr:hypothetical protein B0H19DRAFT_1265543 [Mycena capillaripes]
MDFLPQEMWLRIFALVDSTKALGCVVLVSRKFHVLGMEALVRHITWRSSTVAINHMEFWDRNPSKTHLVRSVYFSLTGGSGPSDPADDYPRIFGCIQSFSKLRHIELAFGTLPDIVYHTLQHLPSVAELTLASCAIPHPPPFFPYSYPSPVQPAPIQVATLKVSKLRPSHANFILDAVTVPIAYHLPNLRAFVTDAIGIQIPTGVSAQLTSLTVALVGVVGDIQPRLDILLQRMPALTHLDVSVLATNSHQAPHGATTTSSASPQPSAPLPALRTLSAPWPAAGHVLLNAPALAHLRVTSPVAKVSDALWVLERLRDKPVRAAALRLPAWDDEVLLAAARCVPECAALEVMYQDGRPSEDFLFNLGIEHLPLLHALHTLRVVALPPAAELAPPRFVWDANPAPAPNHAAVLHAWAGGLHAAPDEEADADAETEEKAKQEEAEAEAETTAGLRECVHAWARYNPALRRVQLGREAGRAWVRRVGGQGHGQGWETDVDVDVDVDGDVGGDGEDEERRGEAWRRMCA